MSEYVLGVNQKELERLQLQQEVWGHVTEKFLDRLQMEKGWSCLDVGCGPGFVVESLRKRVGERGRVVALDESPLWMEHLEKVRRERGWSNVELLRSKIEEAKLEPDSFNLIFLRWVLSFPPNPGEIIAKLAKCLKPGGVIAIQDYNHEGISMFPESEGFRAVVQGTRKMYKSGGGDPWVAGKLPKFFQQSGLELIDYTPNVLCGGPQSPAFRWAGAFFPPHSERMVKMGTMTESDRQLLLKEWSEREKDPASVFFSPIVVDAAARKPRKK